MASSITEAAESGNVLDIINRGIAYAIIAAVFLSVVFIFVGGISFILSGGQEDKIKQAVSTIRYAIFGLVISILAVVIVNFVGQALGIDIVGYIDLKEVYDMVRNIGTSGESTSTTGTL